MLPKQQQSIHEPTILNFSSSVTFGYDILSAQSTYDTITEYSHD